MTVVGLDSSHTARHLKQASARRSHMSQTITQLQRVSLGCMMGGSAVKAGMRRWIQHKHRALLTLALRAIQLNITALTEASGLI